MGIMHNGRTDKRAVMDRTQTKDFARDDLKGDYAGHENKGPAGHQKEDSRHSTNVKGRTTEESKNREKAD
jgi:hypothetical protein